MACIVGNLLDMTRLESARTRRANLPVFPKLIGTALQRTEGQLKGFKVNFAIERKPATP